METHTIEYQVGSKTCKGFMAHDPAYPGPKPTVILCHAWRGQDRFIRERAKDLAALGYLAFALDLYGDRINAHDNEQALELMTPLFLNREELRKSVVEGYHAIKSHPLCDEKKIGGIGYCFGGMSVIELLRSGVLLCGVVTFHATLGTKLGDKKAHLTPIAPDIKGSLLILHGDIDPLVTDENIREFKEELNANQIDWQMNIYGHAMHAFTNVETNAPEVGLVFNPLANKRSWIAMKQFFTEVFA